MSELKTILYVEDEPDIQAVAKIALKLVGGFELKICSTGKALGTLDVIAKPFDPMALSEQIKVVWRKHFSD